MKKYTLLLSLLMLLTVTPSVYAIDIWAVAATNIHNTIGCKDTLWFRMYSPIPTLENSRGKVVHVTEFMGHGPGGTGSITPKNLIPHTDSDVWLSEDRYTIYVVIKNLKLLSLDWTNGKGDFNGPYYGIEIFDRFTEKKDNIPDERIYSNFNMRYSGGTVRLQAGVEEDTRMFLKEKVAGADRWYAPFYVEDGFYVGDTLFNTFVEMKELWVEAEMKYSVYCEAIFGDRKFLRWEMEGRQLDDIELKYATNRNYLEYTIGCGAITDGTTLTLTPIYSKPIPRWNLTITMDSTIDKFAGYDYSTKPIGFVDSTLGEIKTRGDTTLSFSLLKDSSNFFYVSWATGKGEDLGPPLRMISNIPEFNKQSDRYRDSTRWPDLYHPSILYQKIYYHPGYDSVHIHFTRAKEVVSVEEEMPEPGLQQLQWQTTTDQDILLKTPFLYEPGQIELYTIVGSLIEKIDLSSLQRSSEGTLIPTSNLSPGTYLALVKSKNYRCGTVFQIR